MGINVTKPTRGVGTRLVLASQILGIHLDSNVETGGGTDDTAALQAVLNTASASNPLCLILDGAFLASRLTLKSGTTVQALSRACGGFQKAGTDGPLLINAGPTGSGTRANANIAVLGGTYNGNSTNQAHGDAVYGYHSILGFYGVEGLTLGAPGQMLYLKNAKTFSAWLTNVNNVDLHVRCDGVDYINQDGIHVTGNSSRIRGYVEGATKDDLLALNACDWYAAYDPNAQPFNNRALGGWAVEGPITDVDVHLHMDDTVFGYRVLSGSASRMDRIKIRVTGTFTNKAGGVYGATNYGTTLAYEPTAGNAGRIEIDFQARAITPVDMSAGDNIRVGNAVYGVVERLIFPNLERDNWVDNRPTLWQVQGDIGYLDIGALSSDDRQTTDPGVAASLKLDGTVHTLNVRNALRKRKSAFAALGTLVQGNAPLEQFIGPNNISNAAPQPRMTITSGLWGEWDMMQGASASTLYDRSGNNRHGTITNGSFNTAGLALVGTGGAALPQVLDTSNGVTILAAYYTNGNVSVGALFGNINTVTGQISAHLYHTAPAHQLEFQRAVGGTYATINTAAGSSPPGTWAFGYGGAAGDGSSAVVGSALATPVTGNLSNVSPAAATLSSIGYIGATYNYSGTLAYLVIYTRRLSSGEIATVKANMQAALNATGRSGIAL